MYEDNKWQIVEGAATEPFVKSVNPIAGKHMVSVGSAKIEWRQLPFYKNVALVRVADSSWDKGIGPFWFLAKQGQMFHLDGSSTPIHEANELAPVEITEENALDYLRFFCYFVHGDEGPFLIIEDIEDDAFDHSKMDDAMRKVIEGSIQPASYEGKNEKGEFQTTGMVLYGDALFAARFSMTENGLIEMTDDEPIAADLPVTNKRPATS